MLKHLDHFYTSTCDSLEDKLKKKQKKTYKSAMSPEKLNTL